MVGDEQRRSARQLAAYPDLDIERARDRRQHPRQPLRRRDRLARVRRRHPRLTERRERMKHTAAEVPRRVQQLPHAGLSPRPAGLTPNRRVDERDMRPPSLLRSSVAAPCVATP
jgi:hypothetical protein